MLTTRALFAGPAAAVLVFAGAAHAQRIPKSSEVVVPRLVADADRLVAGKPFRLAILADIRPGWHVNSHTPKEDFLIPTEAKIKPAAGLVVSAALYPRHVERKFAFSDQTLAVYEGKTVFILPGTVDAAAAPGPRTLTAALSYQPCNDNQCLPPTELTATLAIEIAKAGSASNPANADVFAPPAAGSGTG
ncbi:MAG: protein-disulfide reductase DsbD domain-containing protein, partial [Thermoanaerobaculia bacterium]